MDHPNQWTATQEEQDSFRALAYALRTDPKFHRALDMARDLHYLEECIERAQLYKYSCYIAIARNAIEEFTKKYMV